MSNLSHQGLSPQVLDCAQPATASSASLPVRRSLGERGLAGTGFTTSQIRSFQFPCASFARSWLRHQSGSRLHAVQGLRQKAPISRSPSCLAIQHTRGEVLRRKSGFLLARRIFSSLCRRLWLPPSSCASPPLPSSVRWTAVAACDLGWARRPIVPVAVTAPRLANLRLWK